MKRSELAKSLEHMHLALSPLDESHGPAEIGCHLDLAISRLEMLLGPRDEESDDPAAAVAAEWDCPRDKY